MRTAAPLLHLCCILATTGFASASILSEIEEDLGFSSPANKSSIPHGSVFLDRVHNATSFIKTSGLKDGAVDAFHKLTNYTSAAWGSGKGRASRAYESVGNYTSAAWRSTAGLKGRASHAYESMGNYTSAAWRSTSGLKGKASHAFQRVGNYSRSIAKGAWGSTGGLKSKATHALQRVSNFSASAWGSTKSAAGSAYNYSSSLLSSPGHSLATAANYTKHAVKGTSKWLGSSTNSSLVSKIEKGAGNGYRSISKGAANLRAKVMGKPKEQKEESKETDQQKRDRQSSSFYVFLGLSFVAFFVGAAWFSAGVTLTGFKRRLNRSRLQSLLHRANGTNVDTVEMGAASNDGAGNAISGEEFGTSSEHLMNDQFEPLLLNDPFPPPPDDL